MSRFAEVQSFVRSVRGAESLPEISAVLSTAARAFAFDHFALVQRFENHVIGSSAVLGPIKLSDYPDAWIDLLGTTDYYVHDPVLVAAEKSVAPFAWDRLSDIIDMSKHQRAYMANASAAGLQRGYTVPIHVPGTASGLCSFVTTGGRELPADSLPAAQYLACFAFEAARRLNLSRPDPDDGGGTVPRLTRRQLDCVVLAARGKSDWVSGQLLGLAPDTVHKYLESAKRRYGVASRTELVVRVLYNGELSFLDILREEK